VHATNVKKPFKRTKRLTRVPTAVCDRGQKPQTIKIRHIDTTESSVKIQAPEDKALNVKNNAFLSLISRDAQTGDYLKKINLSAQISWIISILIDRSV